MPMPEDMTSITTPVIEALFAYSTSICVTRAALRRYCSKNGSIPTAVIATRCGCFTLHAVVSDFIPQWLDDILF
jgi:hypothetical protein